MQTEWKARSKIMLASAYNINDAYTFNDIKTMTDEPKVDECSSSGSSTKWKLDRMAT